jgi:hypothetical protein
MTGAAMALTAIGSAFLPMRLAQYQPAATAAVSIAEFVLES